MLVTIGNFFFRFRNFLFPFALLFVLLPGKPVFSNPMNALLLGFVVALLGQVVRATTIGFKYIIRGGKDRRVYAEDLVTDGLYSHSRNPMYVGNVLILCGVALASNNWTCVLFAIPFCIFIYVAIIAAEENFLRGKFGAAFDAYCRDVPRWLPSLGGLGATLRSMEFKWRRVLVKEYGTPFGWVSGLCAIGLYHLWKSGSLHMGVRTVSNIIALWAVVFVLWAIVRVLKKSKMVVAD